MYVEQQFLFERLEPVKAGYDLERRYMEGTRPSILSQIMPGWPTPRTGMIHQGRIPIGSTVHPESEKPRWLIQSVQVCMREGTLLEPFSAGGKVSETRNVLPTLIYKLAITFPPVRNIVAQRLRNDANLAPESIKGSLLLEFFRSLPRHPKYTLVFVIDALDECGNTQSHPGILKVLTEAATQAPWLKVGLKMVSLHPLARGLTLVVLSPGQMAFPSSLRLLFLPLSIARTPQRF